MAELAVAARTLGFGLDGVWLDEGDNVLTRPVIAFLKTARGGHFAVLRPVGTTGTMVQVIDPPGVSRIVYYTEVLSATSWTGRIYRARPMDRSVQVPRACRRLAHWRSSSRPSLADCGGMRIERRPWARAFPSVS